jgi:DNA-binding NtrC family response regulator
VLDEFERQLIVKALDLTNGVKSRAAQLLGLNRTTLVEKLKKKGMVPPKSPEPARDPIARDLRENPSAESVP